MMKQTEHRFAGSREFTCHCLSQVAYKLTSPGLAGVKNLVAIDEIVV